MTDLLVRNAALLATCDTAGRELPGGWVAVTGGLLMVFAYGQMRWHYDHVQAVRKSELAALEAEKRAREAELAQARAEGLAEGRGDAHVAANPNAVTARATPGAFVDTDGDGVPDRKRSWWRY